MSGIEIASVIGIMLVGIGLIATWVKNGRSQSREFGVLQANLKGVNDKLEHPAHGLSALNEKMGEFKTACALTRSSFTEKIKSAEDDIKELKKKRR